MPLYQQLMESIKADIDSGKYEYESKIPSEPELSEIYSVSRITVRRAVDELCSEGYLVKRQGKGTFVNKPKMMRKMEQTDEVQSFSEVCRLNGMKPGGAVIETQITKVRRDEQQFFGVDEGADLLYIQRVRTADEQPIMLENNFFVYEKFPELLEEPLGEKSLFAVLEEKYNVVPAGGRTTLEIVRAAPIHTELLKVPLGEPLFYMNVYFEEENGTPVMIGRQFIVGSRFKYVF